MSAGGRRGHGRGLSFIIGAGLELTGDGFISAAGPPTARHRPPTAFQPMMSPGAVYSYAAGVYHPTFHSSAYGLKIKATPKGATIQRCKNQAEQRRSNRLAPFMYIANQCFSLDGLSSGSLCNFQAYKLWRGLTILNRKVLVRGLGHRLEWSNLTLLMV